MEPAEQGPALSFVVPVYNEEGNVGPLHAELTTIARATGRPYELVFVNDGSRDGTLERLTAIAATDPHLRVVELDGNFGEAAALSAGFATARGEVVVTMDGDGQNDPHDVPRLLARLDEGFDAVSGRREQRKEDFATRVLPSLVANRLIALATGVPAYDCGCGLKAYRRSVVQGAQLPRGFNRFLPAILGVDPKRVAEITTRDRPRGSGTSHYGLSRVAIVFRDLPSLPLLVRLRAPLRPLGRVLAAALAILVAAAVLGAARGRPGIALVAGTLALVAWAARYNVDRMARARETGVFRVRKVHHARTAVADRDRGSGLLGQEPAPDVR
jgi:glycosyltransferase involved in cell wall biosynthesis